MSMNLTSKEYSPGQDLEDSTPGFRKNFEMDRGRKYDSEQNTEGEEAVDRAREWIPKYDSQVNPAIEACRQSKIPEEAIKREIFKVSINDVPSHRLIGSARRLEPDHINRVSFEDLRWDICIEANREQKTKEVVESLRRLKEQSPQSPQMPYIYN